jgi:hypothetical protein
MRSDRTFRGRAVRWLLSLSLLILGSGFASAQGMSVVAESEVAALKLNHYFTSDKESHDADFEWTFTEKEFVVKKGKAAIPQDLLEKLLPKGMTADEIRGQWTLQDKDGQQLVLTDIKAGEKAGNKKASLAIYKTSGIVVRIGDPQYVFEIRRQ